MFTGNPLSREVYNRAGIKTFGKLLSLLLGFLFFQTLPFASVQAQTQLITASDGGFENATSSFPANGWTAVQPGNARQWQVGTAAGAASGTKAAYLGSSASNNGSNTASVQHFYRDITIPSTASTVRLQFYLKRTTASASDRFRVFITTTSYTPVANVFPTTGYTAVFTESSTAYANFTQMAAIDLDAYIGTTVRVVFTAEENGSNPRANPAVDNITLSCNVPPAISGFAASSACVGGNITINGSYLSSATSVTIGGTPVSSITSNTANQIVAVVGSGTTGTVSVTTAQGTGNSSSSFTVNPLPTAYNVTGGGSYCSGGSGVAVGLSGSQAGVNYTLSPGGTVVAGTGSAISFGNQTTVATYTVSAVNASTGCSANMTGSVAVSMVTMPSITTQPVSQAVCSGGSVSFTVAASGSGLSYQWYKGNTALSNGGAISGATSTTLTINPVAVGDASADYYVVVSNTCGGETSDYVELTVNQAATTPLAQPTLLNFPTIGVSSVIGQFTASASANGYLVVRTNTSTPPSNPVDGTAYAVGSTALGAGSYVEYSGVFTTFTSNGLNQGTTYYYWVFAYNASSCGSSPKYRTASPLNASVTTTTNISCGSNPTLYWAGTGSAYTNPSATSVFNTASNWSTSSSAYVASASAPTGCTNVSILISSANATITLSANAAVYNLDFQVSSARAGVLSTEGFTFTVNGNANIDLVSGAINNSRVTIGENNGGAAGVVDFKGNLTIGTNASGWGSNKVSYFRGNANSKIICRGDVTLGRTFAISSSARPGTIEFDGTGLQQVLWNNDMYFANFYNVVVGNQNSPICRHVTGTYTPDNILNNLTINNSSALDLATSQWIRDNAGGTFSLNNSAKLILSNDKSIPSPASGLGVVVPGSNFPGGFTTMNISSSSTVEYDAAAGINQTIYATPTYGNLVLSNESGSGTSQKTNTATITVSGTTEVKANTTWTLGAGFVSNGAASVKNGATFETNNQTVTGTGSFTTESGSNLVITSTAGISASGATGNIQTTTRNFSTAGNYTYNGSALTNTGTGLPSLVNDLTINNAGGVVFNGTGSSYEVGGTLRMTSGALQLNGKTLTINNLVRSSGTLSSTASSSLVIKGAGVPLYFTLGARFIRNLTLQNNASASLGTNLDVTSGASYGTVTVGSGATLTTNNRLTLRSNALGTARVAEIPADGSGNALGTITGNVTVERYVSAQKAWRLLSVPTGGSQTIKASWQENQAQGSTSLSSRGFQITGETYPANGFDAYSSVPSVKTWNPATAAYDGISSTLQPIANDNGYMVFVRGDRTVTTTLQSPTYTVLRTSGTLKMGKYPSAPVNVGAGQFVSIGNPYASAIDFSMVTRTGGVPNTFYVWDPALTSGTGSRYGFGGFRTITWDAGSGTYIVTPSGGSYTGNTEIESGSAFFVYAPLSAGTVSFTESCKTSGGSLVSRPSQPFGKQLKVNLYVYSGADTILLDGNLTQFGAGYSNQLDELDALKLNNTGENIGISRNRKNYIVERRAEILQADTIPFALGQMKQRTYRLELVASRLSENMTAFLEDKFLQTRTPLDLEGTTRVDFTITSAAPASYASDRFRVVFSSLVRVAQTSITNVRAVRENSRQVNLQWDVNRESRIRRYVVERSLDGINFSSMSTVDPTGNDGGSYNYRSADMNAPVVNLAYRIRAELDNGSESRYSEIVRLPGMTNQVNDVLTTRRSPEETELKADGISTVTVFPNPVVNKQMNVSFKGAKSGTYQLRLFNGSGQVLYSGQVKILSTDARETVRLGDNTPTGSYNLAVTDEAGSVVNIPLIIN